MSCWNKQELENMLEDVVNELNLSEGMIEKHGPLGTAPAELVRIVLDRKDSEIRALKQGFKANELILILGGIIIGVASVATAIYKLL